MKSSIWLRNIFSIVFYLMIILWIIILALLAFSTFINSDKILDFLSESENIIIGSQQALITVLLYSLISLGFWIYIIRLARNLMGNLIDGPLFTKFQAASFKLIGQFLILIAIIDTLSNFLFKAIFNNQIQIKFEFSTFFLIISIGLFMIFLSNIFERAKIYKEENQLTI